MNETAADVSLTVGLHAVDVAGLMATLDTVSGVVPPDSAVELTRIAGSQLGNDRFLHF